MAQVRRRFDPGAQGYGAASAVGVVAGLALIAVAGPTLTAVGVVAVILSAVGLLFSVGVYIGE